MKLSFLYYSSYDDDDNDDEFAGIDFVESGSYYIVSSFLFQSINEIINIRIYFISPEQIIY